MYSMATMLGEQENKQKKLKNLKCLFNFLFLNFA